MIADTFFPIFPGTLFPIFPETLFPIFPEPKHFFTVWPEFLCFVYVFDTLFPLYCLHISRLLLLCLEKVVVFRNLG